MKKINTISVAIAISMLFTAMTALTPVAYAVPGDLLATVHLTPMPSGTSVGGTFDCTHYISVMAGGTTLYWMTPPAGDGNATLAMSKPIVDGAGNPVALSVIAWDPSRGKLWGAYSHNVWLIDVSGANAVATLQFSPTVGGSSLVDGLAWDPSDDTLYYSPDVNTNVYQYSVGGILLNTVTPEDAAGNADGGVSGVAIGFGNTLYIGRNGYAEIRLIDKTTGAFISQFATTAGRVEDVTCDPITYAPKEAILAKDAYNGLYEAFEVEPGTCPCIGETVPLDIDIKPNSCPNPLRVNFVGQGFLPVAILGSEDFDVLDIDVATIALEGVSPTRSAYEDVSRPFEGEECECTTEGADGFMDLILKFRRQDVLNALEAAIGDLGELEHRTDIPLYLTAMLIDEDIVLEGTDCLSVRNRGRIKRKK